MPHPKSYRDGVSSRRCGARDYRRGSKPLFRNDAEQRLVAHDCETVNVAVMRMMWKRHRAKLLVFPLAMFVALNAQAERRGEAAFAPVDGCVLMFCTA
jgi:hypothetical protein